MNGARLSPAVLAVLCALLGVVTNCGKLVAAPPVDVAQARASLENVSEFTFGLAGFAAKTSQGEIAFRQILASPNAVNEFLAVLVSGSPAARCYALVGLRIKDRAIFERTAKKFETFRQQVTQSGGCMVWRQPMSEIVAEIRTGSYEQWLSTPVVEN